MWGSRRRRLDKGSVALIRQMASQGVSHQTIADRMGTSRSVVAAISRGRSYTGVE